MQNFLLKPKLGSSGSDVALELCYLTDLCNIAFSYTGFGLLKKRYSSALIKKDFMFGSLGKPDF